MPRRFRRLFGRSVVADLDAELAFHFEMRVREYVAGGLSPDEARAAVMHRLGDVETARTECRTVGHRQQRREAFVEQFDSLVQDLRLALRTLTRQKAWSMLVIATLALGIGANGTLFTIINAVLLRPLPFPHPERVISISEGDASGDHGVVASPTFTAWRRSARSFEVLAAFRGTSTIVQSSGDPEIVNGLRATSGWFSVMGVQPARGRVFVPGDDRPEGPNVVVLSEQIWRRLFNADSALIGKSVLFDGESYAVIGVMPASFTAGRRAQYWVPLSVSEEPGTTSYYDVVGRLRADASIAGATAELGNISRNLEAPGPSGAERASSPVLMTLHERRFGETRPALLLLLGAVGVLLLIACANVANLLLARNARRQREFAVRVALGASRWRLLRSLLTESAVLSLMGGALGLLLATALTGYFVRLGPDVIARVEGIRVNWTVVGFAFALSGMTAVLVVLIPALSAGRADLNQALARGGTNSTNSVGQNRLRGSLVVAELATSLVLLTGALLLTKSFAHVTSIDAGIRPEGVLTAHFQLSDSRYPGGTAGAFYDRLIERVRALPGVEVTALDDAMPLAGVRMTYSTTRVQDGTRIPSPKIDVAKVSSDYFRALDIRAARGRTFTADDRTGSPPVVVINESMARAMYPGIDAIGQRMKIGRAPKRDAEIVGIVKDVRQRGVEAAVSPMVYLSLAQDSADGYMTLLVRVADPRNIPALVNPIRQAVREIDPSQPMPAFMTMEQAMSDAVAPRRFSFVLLTLFAGLGALLAAIGLYGVMAYLVAERTREIGIRVALGADGRRVTRLIVGQGMTYAAVGIALGLAGSVAAVRMLRTMVFHVDIYDPWAFGAGAVLLAVVALTACYFPARRATHVDPTVALRAD